MTNKEDRGGKGFLFPLGRTTRSQGEQLGGGAKCPPTGLRPKRLEKREDVGCRSRRQWDQQGQATGIKAKDTPQKVDSRKSVERDKREI